MQTFNAFCRSCKISVTNGINEVRILESRSTLYLGECPICGYEIKRIVRKRGGKVNDL